MLGCFFDLVTGLLLILPYVLYLFLLPARWIGSRLDRILTHGYLILLLLIMYFSLIAEVPFWQEFGARFNFIAVDYLIYTYEVIGNINQSYPLPLIFIALALLVTATFVLFTKLKVFYYAFSIPVLLLSRALYTVVIAGSALVLLAFSKNRYADQSNNLASNELSKNGVYSFFAAFRSNELDYDKFYSVLPHQKAYAILKHMLLQKGQYFKSNNTENIERHVQGGQEWHPNIVLVAIESFSAEFISAFGNKDHLTPNYDSLAQSSIFFDNLYATGTRTVRGMEALTLCVPPTPGNSIVRRPDNHNLFSIASILRDKNYHPYFIYGGDGYFDNMNNFFGGQGFDIVDRDRGNPLSDDITTHRYNIPSNEVSFENAWGICDEDLYKQSIKYADKSYQAKNSFFQFIMTTSNHKPFTFPKGKIDLPEGDRNAAVKYTDYALGRFIAEAKTKPWFNNTVFVIVADHCASSAGKWEINIAKHHIPALIYNLRQQPEKIEKLTSQIDIMPTLFGYLRWNYISSLFGNDMNRVEPGQERALIGNYRTLGMLKGNIFTQIDDRKRVKQFNISDQDQSLTECKNVNDTLVQETISYYQVASERFKTGLMKEHTN